MKQIANNTPDQAMMGDFFQSERKQMRKRLTPHDMTRQQFP